MGTTRTSRIAVLTEGGRPIDDAHIEVPSAGPGQILARTLLGGVCGTDVHLRRGDFDLPYPVVLGHEGTGIVEQLGPGVTHDAAGVALAPGDPIYWCPIPPCHHCYYCTVEKDFSSCPNAAWFHRADQPGWGSYSDLVTLPAGMAAYRIPDGTSPEAVIALGCALPAVLQGFDRAGFAGVIDSVVIQGAGPIGLSAVLVAQQRGARTIVVIDQHENRLATARKLGATATLSLSTDADDRRARVHDLCGPHGPQLVVEAAGVLSAFGEGVDLAGHNSCYLLIGLWSGHGATAIDPTVVVHKNLRIVGSCYAQPEHYYKAMHLAATLERKVPLAEIITHRFDVTEVNEALDTVERGDAVKAVIQPVGNTAAVRVRP
ncbi:5-exo-hydroxycamphor dehydrogenase [Nocardia cerradoensis]|uniref:5-exo-hydroxycamphor dehydrogenase n=1 Tax=Nocardia cerradoensis TaxID=85688 RepID=A0A231H429_9NOCA|nr:zinc-binding dehydrogenase [Nocardia cerradoensis]OXR43659.1 5-exo-hydroxycamphor dehydrogenase [Nocardia cerradoensis]